MQREPLVRSNKHITRLYQTQLLSPLFLEFIQLAQLTIPRDVQDKLNSFKQMCVCDLVATVRILA